MSLDDRTEEDFDATAASDAAIVTLRALRRLGAALTFAAPKAPEWQTRSDRRLARRTIPSRHLGGC
jgi:hypothetical protein